MTEVRIQPIFDAWRDAARHLLMQHVPPGRVLWVEDGSAQPVLPGLASPSTDLAVPRVAKRAGIRVSRSFLDSAQVVACHRDQDTFAFLYRVLWRLVTNEPDLLSDEVDPDIRRLRLMEQQVRRDIHKMHAFVRFRSVKEGSGAKGQGTENAEGKGVRGKGQVKEESGTASAGANGLPPPLLIPDPSPLTPPPTPSSLTPDPLPLSPPPSPASPPGDSFISWYEPDHRIVRLAAPFFAERFSTLNWAILTPDECVSWDGHELRFTPGVSKADAPKAADDLQNLWCTYYGSIFNPARIKLSAMKKEMPRRFWKNLPEAQQIDELLEKAPDRVEDMMARSAAAAKADQYPTAEAFLPAPPPSGRLSLTQLAEAARVCRGCPICELGTHTVFGEGPELSPAVFVGEQPGDTEDKLGKPFVGPAGQLLNDALEQVGIDRNRLYVTNAVKHFKFEPRGNGGGRRIHAKPSAREIQACKPWLTAELQVLKPQMVVALGATAAQSMLGPAFRITTMRGQVFTDTQWAPWWMATIHPSALLRIPDPQMREKAYREFLQDLALAAKRLNEIANAA